MSFPLGYKNNIFKDTDKVVLVHAVEMHEILNSQQWYASKYKLSHNNSVSGCHNTCNINKKSGCQFNSKLITKIAFISVSFTEFYFIILI